MTRPGIVRTAAVPCLFVAGLCCVGPVVTAQEKPKRVIGLIIVPPGENPPMLQVTVREGEVASVDLPKIGKYGFKPSVKGDDTSKVRVVILDERGSAPKTFGEVTVDVGGKRVSSETTPRFSIAATRVTDTKHAALNRD